MQITDQVKQLLAKKDYDRLEDLWTDLITAKDLGPDEYCRIADVINEAGDSERAILLLELLSDHYETQHAYSNALEIQKHLLRYQKESSQIRKKLINIYRRKYTDSLHLEDYLELSGLSKDEPIMKAIRRFEDYLQYDIGNYFFFERYGLGRVIDVNPKMREIVVDFEKKKKHYLTLDVAQGVLTPVNEHHFLYQKRKNATVLKTLASERPAELVVLLLSSFRKPLSASEIKGYLEGIVGSADISKFWERTRRILEKHDNIKVAGRATKTYAYVASAEDKKNQSISAFHNASLQEKYRLAEEYSIKMPEIFKTITPHLARLVNQVQHEHPGLAIDILMLLNTQNKSTGPNQPIDEIVRSNSPEAILKDMVNPDHQKRMLSILREKQPQAWIDTASQLVFANDDFRLLDALAEQLMVVPDKLDDIYHRILAMPKQYPKQFHWMLKKIETGQLDEYMKPTLIPRLIDCLDYVSGVKATVKAILSLPRFDALLSGADTDTAARILNAIKKSNTLTRFEKGNFARIMEHHFPDLAEEKTDIIYTSEAALRRKQGELEHLLNVQIPENKKEIGRAREFGDLSENFEYKAAKEKQDQLYEKAKTIESELRKAQLIEPDSVQIDRVGVGTAITLKRADDGSVVTYRILGRWDTDLNNNIISNEAPFARSMLGKKIGDLVEIEGVAYSIADIKRADDTEECNES
jgi:transcription elongation factor GreA